MSLQLVGGAAAAARQPPAAARHAPPAGSPAAARDSEVGASTAAVQPKENPLPTGYVQLWALCSTVRGGVCLLASLAVSAGPTVVSMAKLPDWYAAASTGLRCLPLLAGLQTRLDPHLVGWPPTQQLPAAALAHSLVQLSSDIVAGSRAVLEHSMHSSAPPSAVLDEEGQMAIWQLHSATCRLVHWAASSSGYTTLQCFSAAAPAWAELQVTMLTAACLLLLSVCRLWHQRAAHDQPDSGAAGGSGSQAEVDKRLRYTADAAAHPTAGVLALAALMVLAARWAVHPNHRLNITLSASASCHVCPAAAGLSNPCAWRPLRRWMRWLVRWAHRSSPWTHATTRVLRSRPRHCTALQR